MQQNSLKRPREWVCGGQRANVRRRTWSEEKGESFFESLRVFHEKKPESALKDDMLKSLAHNKALFKKNMQMRNSGKDTGPRSAQLSDTSGVQSEHTGHEDSSSKGSRGVQCGSSKACKRRRISGDLCQQAHERHRASSTATSSSDDLEIVGSPSLKTRRMVRNLGKYVAGVKRKQVERHQTSGNRGVGEASTSVSSSSSNLNPTPQADRENGQKSTFEIVDLVSSSGDSSDTDSSLPKSQSSLNVTFDSWDWDEEEARRSFRASVVSHGDMSEDSAPLIRAFRAYNLRPREADKPYRETSSSAAPVPETARERRERRKRNQHGARTSKAETKHNCPCHNIEICIRMLHAAHEPDLATLVLNADRPPRMTPKLLSILYPENERLSDQELLGHRVVIDEDQAVHETAPYAFLLNGWPREVGGYDFRINKLAKREDMDVVDREVEVLLGLYAIGAQKGGVIDLTGESDGDVVGSTGASENRRRKGKFKG